MKTKSILLLATLLLSNLSAVAKVKLPTLFSEGMVLQREQPIKIWGSADAGEAITVTLGKKKQRTVADADGNWWVELPAMKAGGPWKLQVNELQVEDILIGDLWLCSGQSNMELTVDRVTDLFAQEIATDENSLIRYVKTPYGNEVDGPKTDIRSMEWKRLTVADAPSFSALPYFFAKELIQHTQVPIGIINSSWGGSSVEAWMSEKALQAFPRQLSERDLLASPAYRELCNQAGGLMNKMWDATLYRTDKGIQAGAHWSAPQLDESDWSQVDVFSDAWGKKNGYAVNGSHWFRQTLSLTHAQAAEDAVLRLGCLVDADSVFVNGTFVGNTFYQYPPRIYKVPASLLKAGENQVTIRLISYSGNPSFVADKPYCLAWEQDTLSLSRVWNYQLGCEMPARQGGVSFQNVPTGMYNCMIAPLRNLAFKGVLWYQGETNTGRPNEYEALLTSLIADWRLKLDDEELPFFVVQLANFMQHHTWPVESGWARLREAQRQVALKDLNTHLGVAIDLGEWNDIHPLDKKELARRLSLLVRKAVYGEQELVYSGPICNEIALDGGKLLLSFEAGTDALSTKEQLQGFAIAGADGRYRWAEAAVVSGNRVAVWHPEVASPCSVRYAWDDNPATANLMNEAGLPASPFEMCVGR
ncbi:MAG: sialate O-acetylesterase [Phocaeicola sp.]